MAKKKIKDLIAEELHPFLEDHGFELYHVEFVKEAKDWFLRVYIDKAPGENGEDEFVSTDDCETVSRYLSSRLDETDPIEQNYYLEVSSPGLDRELIKEADYERFAGRAVEIKLYKAIDGKKTIEGILESIDDGKITVIDEKNQKIQLSLEQVAKTNLAVIF